MDHPNEILLLDNPIQPPRIIGLTGRLILYYQNPITGQLITVRLRRRSPHPLKNRTIHLNRYRNKLEKYYFSTERITNPERYHRKKQYYKLVIRLLKKELRHTKNCIA